MAFKVLKETKWKTSGDGTEYRHGDVTGNHLHVETNRVVYDDNWRFSGGAGAENQQMLEQPFNWLQIRDDCPGGVFPLAMRAMCEEIDPDTPGVWRGLFERAEMTLVRVDLPGGRQYKRAGLPSPHNPDGVYPVAHYFVGGWICCDPAANWVDGSGVAEGHPRAGTNGICYQAHESGAPTNPTNAWRIVGAESGRLALQWTVRGRSAVYNPDDFKNYDRSNHYRTDGVFEFDKGDWICLIQEQSLSWEKGKQALNRIWAIRWNEQMPTFDTPPLIDKPGQNDMNAKNGPFPKSLPGVYMSYFGKGDAPVGSKCINWFGPLLYVEADPDEQSRRAAFDYVTSFLDVGGSVEPPPEPEPERPRYVMKTAEGLDADGVTIYRGESQGFKMEQESGDQVDVLSHSWYWPSTEPGEDQPVHVAADPNVVIETMPDQPQGGYRLLAVTSDNFPNVSNVGAGIIVVDEPQPDTRVLDERFLYADGTNMNGLEAPALEQAKMQWVALNAVVTNNVCFFLKEGGYLGGFLPQLNVFDLSCVFNMLGSDGNRPEILLSSETPYRVERGQLSVFLRPQHNLYKVMAWDDIGSVVYEQNVQVGPLELDEDYGLHLVSLGNGDYQVQFWNVQQSELIMASDHNIGRTFGRWFGAHAVTGTPAVKAVIIDTNVNRATLQTATRDVPVVERQYG